MEILFSGAIPGDHPFGIRALLAVLDTETGEIRHLVEYDPPDELRHGQYIQFTGFRRTGDALYVCVFNEILRYDGWPPPQQPSARITHPQFNDLHDCLPLGESLLVANTGLETVDEIDLDGRLIRRFDLLEGEPGAREIDPGCDYRTIPSTKPHEIHVNHVFQLDGELWATRFCKRDAICLTRPGPSISTHVGNPHDGTRIGNEIVFTTTNGHLVRADVDDVSSRRIHELSEMTPGLQQLGWCRGVCGHPEDPNLFFVAFSKARRSKWREAGFWIRHRHDNPQSRICLYDVARGALRETWLAGKDPGYVLFQIEPL